LLLGFVCGGGGGVVFFWGLAEKKFMSCGGGGGGRGQIHTLMIMPIGLLFFVHAGAAKDWPSGAQEMRLKSDEDFSVVCCIGPVSLFSSSQLPSQSHNMMTLSEPHEARYLFCVCVCL